jgi:D-glycero-D-manno-heptose 1,7-bisphosphate phosphatase
MAIKKPAIFLDRDGVINDTVDRGENFFVYGKKVRWTAPFKFNEFKLKTGIAATLKLIGQSGFLRILVSNQPDIAYGTMPLAEHEKIMAEVKKLPLDDIFICVHGRDDNCECKKPKPGMLFSAAKKHNIDLASSYIIGDTQSDVSAGKAAGCATVLINRIYNQDLTADFRIKNLLDIIKII